MTTATILAALLLVALPSAATAQDAAGMTFFVTSAGPGDGANLGGLAGADAHCQQLAEAAGSTGSTWAAYLSAEGVDARDRIGAGPWHNFRGALIARDVGELHSIANRISRPTALTETGAMINGRGMPPIRHDVMTGSNADGTLAVGMTCGDWTSNGAGAAMTGHSDRLGRDGMPTATSWNAAHPSVGCSQSDLETTGGAGYFYCFAAD